MEQSKSGRALSATWCILCGPDHTQLRVLGKYPLRVMYNGASCTQQVYVVHNLKNNLLGFPAVKSLNLLSHVDSIKIKLSFQGIHHYYTVAHWLCGHALSQVNILHCHMVARRDTFHALLRFGNICVWGYSWSLIPNPLLCAPPGMYWLILENFRIISFDVWGLMRLLNPIKTCGGVTN